MLRKAVTVGGLFGTIALLGLLHQPSPDAFNAEAMAVFGFIVLTAYMLGDLAESIHLPHITGYLLTGAVCGPEILGLLDPETLHDLELFESLAVALIALSAGAALTMSTLKKGFRLFSSVMAAQFFFTLLLVGGGILLCSGLVPGLTLPFLVDAPWGYRLAAAVCLGLVASAMSPPTAIAVIRETKANGEMTDAVMGISVLNNVVVAGLFALGLTLAGALAPDIYTAHNEHGLGASIAQNIGGAALFGGILGLGIAAYIRFLGRELMLIITGLCFTLTWAAHQAGVDPILSFLVAGFVARNAFPNEEVSLSRVIAKLSLPVYVVFFFLVGAGLHLSAIPDLWSIALLLFGARLLALYLGTRVGATVGGGSENLKRYGWLGFGAQAGIALSMAKVLEGSFGEAGVALETLAVAGIALNEIFGPVLLKIGLGMAGETRAKQGMTQRTAREEPVAETETESIPEDSAPLEAWLPESGSHTSDPWETEKKSPHKDIARISRNLRAELQSMVRDLRAGPIASRRETGLDFISQLRREFLRFHRRCMVLAQDPTTEESLFLSTLSRQRSQLAARWQDHILDRAALADYRPEKRALNKLTAAVDSTCGALPTVLTVPMDPELLENRTEDSPKTRLSKRLARLSNILSSSPGERLVEVEKIARFSLGSELSQQLEQVAGLLAVTDRHLMSRARNIFEAYRHSMDAAISSERFEKRDWESLLQHVREEMEEEFTLATSEIDRLADEAVRAASGALASPYQNFVSLLEVAGSPECPPSHYQASKVYDQRLKAMTRIETGLEAARVLSRGVGNKLAMELELLRLQTRVHSLIHEKAQEFERDLHGRVVIQTARIQEALASLLHELQEKVRDPESSAVDVETSLKSTTDDFAKLLVEAKSISSAYLSTLRSERVLSPIREELSLCIDMVKDNFSVFDGRSSLTGRGLPQDSKTRLIPFRRLVRQYMDAEVSRSLSDLAQELSQGLVSLQTSIEELERALTYNTEVCLAELELNTASTLSKETQSLLESMLIKTLERHSNRIEDDLKDAKALSESAQASVTRIVTEHLESMQTLLVQGRYNDVEALLAKAQAYARRKAIQNRFLNLEDLSSAARGLMLSVLGETGAQRLRGLLGLRDEEPPQELGPSYFELAESPADVPIVYRRIFQDPSLEARDLLRGKETEVQNLHEHLLGKRRSPSRAAAIIFDGATDGGALLHAITRGLGQELKVVRHCTKGSLLDSDVDGILQSATGNCLVIVEDLRRLTRLHTEGLNPLRRLAEGILSDRGKNAWLVSCELSSWTYIQHHLSLDGVFPERLSIERLNPESMRRAILERHGMSGFGLQYEEIEPSLLWKLGRKLQRKDAAFDASESQIFQILHQETAGVLRDALHLWVASIQHIQAGKDLLTIRKPQTMPMQALRALPLESLLSLRQAVRQGYLAANDHAIQFQ
ncbi:MAG: cation:proton antiporter, partial [Myxococcota bacterium]|nr:cation:proton antiporter [Myxococcota bacterium]